MYFKVFLVYVFGVTSARAGFLNIGQNLGNHGHLGGDVAGGNFGFQQVPLTLTPGPLPQSSGLPSPHATAVISNSFSGQQQQQQLPQQQQQQLTSSSYNSGPAATSASYRQQQVNSVPGTITTHGVATSFVALPTHGFLLNNDANQNAGNNNGLSNNGGASTGSYGYGGYGYSFSSAGGNAAGNSGNNQGNNAGGYLNGYSENGAPGNNGFSG